MKEPITLAIALGANLPSKVGPPKATLIEVRPKLEATISEWISSLPNPKRQKMHGLQGLAWRWSPLFKTTPIGGPENQPSYIKNVP